MKTFSNFSPECLIFSVLSSVQSLHWYDWKHWYNPVLVSSTQVHHAVKCNKLKKRFKRSQRSRNNIKARGAPTAVTSLLVCVAVLDGDNGEHEQDQISVGTIITFILIILLISVDLYRWWRRPKIVIDTFSLVTDVSTFFTAGEIYWLLVCLFEREGFASSCFPGSCCLHTLYFTKRKLFRK